MIDPLIDIARVLAFFGITTFALAYHLRAPWWRSEMGMNVMTFCLSVAILLGIASLQAVFGPGWYFDVCRLLATLGLAYTGWWRLVVLLKVQLRVPEEGPDVSEQS